MNFTYEFEWDPSKATVNIAKHGVTFEEAAEVFRDPLALSIQDEEHSDEEIRWITLGRDTQDHYVLVVHTFEQLNIGVGKSALDFRQTFNQS